MASATSPYSSAKSSAQHNNDCNCILEDVLKKRFGQRDNADKQRVLERGRPTPEIAGLYLVYSDREKKYRRRFCVSNYEKHKWLTGCPKLNKLYCWPCVLFSREKSAWSREGLGSISGLSQALSRHEKSRSHIHCAFIMCTFGGAAVDTQAEAQKARTVSKHNETVKSNRAILTRLIDITCLLAKQKIPFRHHDETQESVNKGNYVEVVNFLSGYDHVLKEHLKYSTVFRGTSPGTQNDLVEAVGVFLMNAIKKEVSCARFVAILLDECSDNIHKSQLSTVLRYVDGSGEVQERFIGFNDIGTERSAEVLYKHVISVVKEFHLKGKLVAQTYDGAVALPKELWALHAKVKESFPQAPLVHYHSHSLTYVLQSSATFIKECKVFFLTLTGLSNFFSKTAKRMDYLRSFIKKKLPKLSTSRWNFTTKLVQTVHEHRHSLILFLEYVIDADSSGDWDATAIMQAQGSILFLRQFETIFLLQTFSAIFAHADALYNVFQSKYKDVAYCHNKVTETMHTYSELRRVGFPKVWENVSENLDGAEERSKKKSDGDSLESAYKKLFDKILEHTIVQISCRFSSLQSFHFMSLLDSGKFSSFKGHFPDALTNNLVENYGGTFDVSALMNELIVLYATQDNDIFGKSVNEMMSVMHSKHLIWAMPELYKLACLVSTIPSAMASVDRTISAMKKIKAYCQSTETHEQTGPISLISIEKNLLVKLRNDLQSKFDDEVIELFVNKTRRPEFVLKLN